MRCMHVFTSGITVVYFCLLIYLPTLSNLTGVPYSLLTPLTGDLLPQYGEYTLESLSLTMYP